MGLKLFGKKEPEIKTEVTYINEEGDRLTLDENGALKPEMTRLKKCIPLGYGVVGFRVRKVETDEDWGAKRGDLIITYGHLPKKVEPGSSLSQEQLDYMEEHQACNLVMTKDYALRLAELLLHYANER